mgnify:CR=1 FL=1
MLFPAAPSPDAWTLHLFSAKAARQGGGARRKIRDIERYVGLAAFLEELDRCGYNAVENAGQLIIFRNQKPVKVVARRAHATKHRERFEIAANTSEAAAY